MDNRIPVFLIKNTASSSLQKKLENNSKFIIVDAVLEKDIIKIKRVREKKPDILVIFDMDGFERERLVINSLMLRNKDYQVFISLEEDFDDLIELTKDAHAFIKQNLNQTIVTEIIVTHKALNLLGDVSEIVRHYELYYLGKENLSLN